MHASKNATRSASRSKSFKSHNFIKHFLCAPVLGIFHVEFCCKKGKKFTSTIDTNSHFSFGLLDAAFSCWVTLGQESIFCLLIQIRENWKGLFFVRTY